jgi:hypothetical protein
MFQIDNESDLKSFFREVDQPEVILSDDLKFPVRARDYLRWLEPSGNRVYLIFKVPTFKAPLGIVFRRDQALGPAVAAMCEWCHAVRSGNEIGVLTATSSKKKRIGLSLCRDLSCADKIRSAPGANDFSSNASIPLRIERVLEKMADVSRRELL